MEGKTTIQVETDTWRRLQELKRIPREVFNDVIVRLLDQNERREDRTESRRAS